MLLLKSLATSIFGGAGDSPAAADHAPRARVSELWIYPVKSMKGQQLTTCELDGGMGLRNDRRFLVVRESDGRFQTQRQIRMMTTLTPSFTEVDAEGAPRKMRISMDPEHTKPVDKEAAPFVEFPVLRASSVAGASTSCLRTVKVWGDRIENAVDQGDAVADWLTKVLQAPSEEDGTVERLRLVYFDTAVCKRPVDEEYVPPSQQGSEYTGFADGFPVLLTSEASLEDLNKKIEENHHAATAAGGAGDASEPAPRMAMTRFRPNIVVQQLPSSATATEATMLLEPWVEEEWLDFSIVDPSDTTLVKAVAQGVKKCSRCTVTTTDQTTAEQGGNRKAEPLRTLFAYRADKASKNCFFGSNLLIRPAASSSSSSSVKLVVGDLITVQRTGIMPPTD